MSSGVSFMAVEREPAANASPNVVALSHVSREITLDAPRERTACACAVSVIISSVRSHHYNEGATPTVDPVRGVLLYLEVILTYKTRYVDGNETYTFVPVEPVGARSLTIYRNSGDIVLNCMFIVS